MTPPSLSRCRAAAAGLDGTRATARGFSPEARRAGGVNTGLDAARAGGGALGGGVDGGGGGPFQIASPLRQAQVAWVRVRVRVRVRVKVRVRA